MRWLLCSLLVLSIVSLAAPHAWAHGGTYSDGRPGTMPPGFGDPSDPTPPPPPPPPPPPGSTATAPTFCECGYADCKKCMTEDVRNGNLLSKCVIKPEVLEQWGAVQHVRTQYMFRTKGDVKRTEGYVRVTQGTLCAVGAVRFDGLKRLEAKEVGAAQAGPAYMRTMRKIIDPVLYMRRGAAQFDLRVFPVLKGHDATAVTEMYVLTEQDCTEIELYRSTDHIMALVPLEFPGRPAGAHLVDLENGRAVYFLSAKEAEQHAFFKEHLAKAQAIPCVAPLKKALLEGKDEAWVGIDDAPQGGQFRGPGGTVPPGMHEPSDPLPPPPPEDAPTAPTTETTETTEEPTP